MEIFSQCNITCETNMVQLVEYNGKCKEPPTPDHKLDPCLSLPFHVDMISLILVHLLLNPVRESFNK